MGSIPATTEFYHEDLPGNEIPAGVTDFLIQGGDWFGGPIAFPPVSILVNLPNGAADPVIASTGPWETVIPVSGFLPTVFTVTFQGANSAYTLTFTITSIDVNGVNHSVNVSVSSAAANPLLFLQITDLIVGVL